MYNGQSIADLQKQCVEDSTKWFGDSHAAHSIPHHALALAGEVGEFANIVKKVDRGSLSIHDAAVRHDMAMELADIFTYLMNIAGLLGVDLGKAYQHKRAQNEKRFTEQRKEREARPLRIVKDNPQA